ncbi:unnamed protein product, partial [Ectocarpus sp. 8 AP-2014]
MSLEGYGTVGDPQESPAAGEEGHVLPLLSTTCGDATANGGREKAPLRQGARFTPAQHVDDDSNGETDLNHALGGRDDRVTRAGTAGGGPSLWRAILANHLW